MAADASSVEPVRNCSGFWSAKGRFAYEPPRRIEAPDGKHAIVPADPSLSLVGDRGSAARELGLSLSLTEILWAPDSRRFAATTSDGGLVGTWRLFVSTIGRGGKPRHRELSDAIQRETRTFGRCYGGPETRNVGAAGWLNADELLVIAEVPPHSSCSDMGAITGFRVSVRSGKVLERVPERKLRDDFRGLLGCRFVPP